MKCVSRITFRDHSVPLLSYTSAMACYSWSLPAGKAGSCPMEDQTPGSICSCCYAQQYRYQTPRVIECQYTRLRWTQHCIDSSTTTSSLWQDTMRAALFAHVDPNGYFRVHDSGDFFSTHYIDAWYYLAKDLQGIRFWFPTRAWVFPGWMFRLQRLHSLHNANVTPSAVNFNDPPPRIPGLGPGLTAVTSEAHLKSRTVRCPKSWDGGSCQSHHCRHCWDKQTTFSTAYLAHGVRVTDKMRRNHARVALTVSTE